VLLGTRPSAGVLVCRSDGVVKPADPVDPVEVGKHQDVEQLGAGSRTEGIETLSESMLELVGLTDKRLFAGGVILALPKRLPALTFAARLRPLRAGGVPSAVIHTW
jgi:hypothetical protein